MTQPLKIEFNVWQFVRVMVYLEAHPKAGAEKGAPGLLEIWRDIWEPLDKELAKLSSDDFSAYANMMMDQSVVLEDVSSATAGAAYQVLERIAADMEREIKTLIASGGDKATIENLQFEKSELLRSSAVIQAEM